MPPACTDVLEGELVNVFKTLLTCAITCSIMGAMLAAPARLQAADPPRRAARLGYLGGTVSLTPAGLQEATPAEVNRPFTTGDRFWSGADGRGELQTDNAAIRFSGRASFAIQELSNQATLIRLESGTLSVRLHALAPLEDFEIDTPQFTFHLKRLGAYLVDAGEKGDGVVAAVRLGDAEVFRGDGATMTVPRGMQARASAAGSPILEPAHAIGEFEAWCVQRDQHEDLSRAAQFVSRDIPGYADLDDHGEWRTVNQYGWVWFPSNMDADWAPYRSGHFVDAGPWGMNWVDEASWGFGPLHYGRWLKVNGAWGWVPGEAGKSARPGASGQFAVRPYYTPALVVWNRFAAGVVRPNAVVGWFPLGPGEAWVPQFRASADYLARVNLSNTLIADRAALDNPDVTRLKYMNREAADITALAQEDLAAGRVVGKQYVRVPQADDSQGVLSSEPGVEATKEARLGPLGTAPGAPPGIANRTVVEHRLPVSEPVPMRLNPNGVTGGTVKINRAQSEPRAQRLKEPQTPTKSEPPPEPPPKPQPVPEPQPEPQPQAKPQPSPKPAPQPQPKVQTRQEPRPQANIKPKPQPKALPGPQPKIAPRPPARPQTPPRPKPQVPPKPQPRPQTPSRPPPPRPQPPPPKPK
jgi:hypothetical protein